MMSNDDVARAGQAIRALVLDHYPHLLPEERSNVPSHLLYMMDRVEAFMRAGEREKAMRWLGFAQGAVWQLVWASIEELKDSNRPRDHRRSCGP